MIFFFGIFVTQEACGDQKCPWVGCRQEMSSVGQSCSHIWKDNYCYFPSRNPISRQELKLISQKRMWSEGWNHIYLGLIYYTKNIKFSKWHRHCMITAISLSKSLSSFFLLRRLGLTLLEVRLLWLLLHPGPIPLITEDKAQSLSYNEIVKVEKRCSFCFLKKELNL